MAVLQNFVSYLLHHGMAMVPALLHMTDTQYSTANKRWSHSMNIEKPQDRYMMELNFTSEDSKKSFLLRVESAKQTRSQRLTAAGQSRAT